MGRCWRQSEPWIISPAWIKENSHTVTADASDNCLKAGAENLPIHETDKSEGKIIVKSDIFRVPSALHERIDFRGDQLMKRFRFEFFHSITSTIWLSTGRTCVANWWIFTAHRLPPDGRRLHHLDDFRRLQHLHGRSLLHAGISHGGHLHLLDDCGHHGMRWGC